MEFYESPQPPGPFRRIRNWMTRRKKLVATTVMAVVVALPSWYMSSRANHVTEMEAYPSLSLRCDIGTSGNPYRQFIPSQKDGRDDYIQIDGPVMIAPADRNRAVATCELHNGGELSALNVTLHFAVYSERIPKSAMTSSLTDMNRSSTSIPRIGGKSSIYLWFIDNTADRLFEVVPLQPCTYELQGDTKRRPCSLQRTQTVVPLPYLQFPVTLWPLFPIGTHVRGETHVIHLRPMKFSSPTQ